MFFKSYEELIKSNPEAVTSDGGEYLERPDDGWRSSQNDGFIGIGYHGNESGYFRDKWRSDKKGKGHIPSGGYG